MDEPCRRTPLLRLTDGGIVVDGVRLPVATLVCNQAPPTDGQPSLCSFREVETLFHEFGHGLQHMLTTVDESMAAGINKVEWDAVELPSQFMENWCYHEDTIMGMSGHVETGEPLPQELYQKLLAARTFNAGAMMLRQLLFASTDLELHHTYDPALADVGVVYRRNAERISRCNQKTTTHSCVDSVTSSPAVTQQDTTATNGLKFSSADASRHSKRPAWTSRMRSPKLDAASLIPYWHWAAVALQPRSLQTSVVATHRQRHYCGMLA